MNDEPTEVAIADFQGLLGSGEYDFGIVSEHGVVLRDEISQTRWLDLTQQALNIYEYTGKKHCEILMKIGDLLRFGEEKFGESWSQAISDTRRYLQLSQKSLANAMWVCGKIAPAIRRPELLSFAHHEAVAKLPADEQDEFLRLAEDEGLTTSELKKKIKQHHPSKPRAPKATIKVKIEPEPTAMLDAARILSTWLSEYEQDITAEEWKEPLAGIYKLYRRRFIQASRQRENGGAE